MSEGRLTVLILGGYGTFGGRLAELLASEPELTLIIAGRSAERAAAFCARLPHGATKLAIAIDRDDRFADRLAQIAPDIVVDATGPFQAYGAEPYRVVEACLACGIHYLDLADASGFVEGIAKFDQEARGRGVFVLAGASSFPVLTAAVVAELASGLVRLDSITAGIAPSPYAGIGENVIRAIASYAGKPVELWRDGGTAFGYGLTETRRFTIAPPGALPLRSTLFSLVDVPDLRALPRLWPGLRSVWMGAGPVPAILHRILIALAWLVRLKLLPTLSPLAGLFHGVANVVRWGEHRGGMFVVVEGSTEDGPIERSWHLLVEGDDGPFIPSMTCEVILRHCLAGRVPAPGARSAAGELSLAEYEAPFARRAITTGTREIGPETSHLPLYRRILGSAFDTLPEPIRAMHDLTGSMTVSGRADIDRGTSILAETRCRPLRLPEGRAERSNQGPLRGEKWHRDLAPRLRREDVFQLSKRGDGPIRAASLGKVRPFHLRPGCSRRNRAADAGSSALELPRHAVAAGACAKERFLRIRR